MLNLRLYCAKNRFSRLCSSVTFKNKVDEHLDFPEHVSPYYVENGLRKVYPYYKTYSTFCKGRWFKRKLLDVLATEYSLFPRQEYVKRISSGLLIVNNKIVDLDYVLKDGDVITSTDHRHELGVLATSIEILFENEDFLVINKPPSTPVYPTGLYRHNTILFILENEYNYKKLYVTHRIDRLTSGVLVLAKSSEKASQFHREMVMGNVKKEYICRVEGNFPDGTVICNKPIKKFHHRIGVNLVHPEGKSAMSEFKKISFNGTSSVVLCQPYTGRTHQLRVHLQFLGYPIVNDPLYNNIIFGPEKGKNGVISDSIKELLEGLSEELTSKWFYVRSVLPYNEENYLNSTVFKNHAFNDKFLSSNYKKDDSKVIFDKECFFCNTATKNPEQTSLGIFLHAYKYKGNGWEFKSNMPFWSSESWNDA